MTQAPVTKQDVADAKARYERLRDLYAQLQKQLGIIEKNNKYLRVKVQEAGDKNKMKQILQGILSQKE